MFSPNCRSTTASSPSISAAPICAAPSRTDFRNCPIPAGVFPQVSGLTIEADASRPAGDRIVSIKVGDAPLDERQIYRIATNDFMARGGDGYTEFRDAKPLLSALDAPLVSNAVIAYIKALGTVRTNADGRIVTK